MRVDNFHGSLKHKKLVRSFRYFRFQRSMADGATNAQNLEKKKYFLSRVTNKINRRNNKVTFFRLRNTIESKYQSFHTHAPVSLVGIAFALRLAHFRAVPLND